MVSGVHKVLHINGVDIQPHYDSDSVREGENMVNETVLEVGEVDPLGLRLKRRQLFLTCAVGVFLAHFALGLLQENMLVFFNCKFPKF